MLVRFLLSAKLENFDLSRGSNASLLARRLLLFVIEIAEAYVFLSNRLRIYFPLFLNSDLEREFSNLEAHFSNLDLLFSNLDIRFSN